MTGLDSFEPRPVNVGESLDSFTDHWSPKIIADLNDHHLKVAKLEGDFLWHSHPDTDEAFLVIKGHLRIDFRDHSITLNQGELLVIPKGVEHKPQADSECQVLLFVRAGTLNTGNAPASHRTTDPNARIEG